MPRAGVPCTHRSPRWLYTHLQVPPVELLVRARMVLEHGKEFQRLELDREAVYATREKMTKPNTSVKTYPNGGSSFACGSVWW